MGRLAAASHAKGLRTQETISGAAFARIAGIQSLHIGSRNQRIIMDACVHLAGFHSLDMEGCDQETISDAVFAHLAGIHTLDMEGCDVKAVTGAVFVHLAGHLLRFVLWFLDG